MTPAVTEKTIPDIKVPTVQDQIREHKERKAEQPDEEARSLQLALLADEMLDQDINNLMQDPGFRRVLRFILGPQCSNLLGPNTSERGSAVTLINRMMKADELVLARLFSTQKEDENGYR